MDFNQHSHVIVVYPSYEVAILAFDQLIIAGFSPANVSIVGKAFIQPCCSEEASCYQAVRQASTKIFVSSGNALNVGWRIGSILGGTIRLLLGHSIASLPGVNSILLLSKIIFALASGFFCSVSSGMMGTLIAWRMSQKQVREWNDLLTQGNYLLVMNGSKDEITRAKRFFTTSFKEKVSLDY